jgi:hypothetical protein
MFEMLTRHRLIQILEEKGIQRGIIVFPGTMTPSARKVRPQTQKAQARL